MNTALVIFAIISLFEVTDRQYFTMAFIQGC